MIFWDFDATLPGGNGNKGERVRFENRNAVESREWRGTMTTQTTPASAGVNPNALVIWKSVPCLSRRALRL